MFSIHCCITLDLQAKYCGAYGKPVYDVWEKLGDEEVPIRQELIQSLPFGDLLRFTPEDGRDRPKVLIVAALSGHFATLLQDTIRGFARDFDIGLKGHVSLPGGKGLLEAS